MEFSCETKQRLQGFVQESKNTPWTIKNEDTTVQGRYTPNQTDLSSFCVRSFLFFFFDIWYKAQQYESQPNITHLIMLFLKEVFHTASFENQTWVDNQTRVARLFNFTLQFIFFLKYMSHITVVEAYLTYSEKNKRKLNKTHTSIFWQMSSKLFASFLFINTLFPLFKSNNKILLF